MPIKEILSFIGMFLAVYGLIPYYKGIFARTNKPHAFSWMIFAIVTGIATVVQFAEDAGPGKWILALNSFMCLTIALLAIRFGEKDIRRTDWVALAFAFLAIPLWVMTNNPLWAVLIAMGIEVSAYYPTIRKSWHKPYEEVAQTWFIGGFMFLISVAALDKIVFVSAAYPAFVATLNFILVAILLYRRRMITVWTQD